MAHKTALITHQACFEHVETSGHAEKRTRLSAVLDALAEDRFPDLVRLDAPRAELTDILRVHTPDYARLILEGEPTEGWHQLDADTALSPGSAEAALRVAGASIAAVDGVMTGQFRRAFCAVRPPGHHARPANAMGFCLFNGIAIAAKRAMQVHGLIRVAIIDFDVHHGNGTQEMLMDEPGMLYASIHQAPLYPGTGLADERGMRGRIVNVPLPAGTGSAQWRQAFEERISPAIEAFSPELILISAGFDGHHDDPLAGFELAAADFSWITTTLVHLADKSANGRVVSVLEGGYDLTALGQCSVAHVQALSGQRPPEGKYDAAI